MMDIAVFDRCIYLFRSLRASRRNYEIPYLEMGVAIGNSSCLYFKKEPFQRRCLAEIVC
jgi:hypothetical protein